MNDRRDFLKTLAGLTTGIMLPHTAFSVLKSNVSDKWGDLLPLRKLGSTGESVTMLGLGGNHIGHRMDEYEAQRTIEAAMEGGVRFFDNAESYQRGEAEIRFGKYLVPKYRDEVFIMTKTRATDAETARQHLENSLSRMKVDYVDLWQVHAVRTAEDIDNRIENGVIDVFEEAIASGKVRYAGFSGHTHHDAHLYMLERKNIFHAVQMPVNPVDAAATNSFIKNVMPVLTDRNIGILAMKALADGRFFEKKETRNGSTHNPVVPDYLSLKDVLYFVWSLPISVLILGSNNADMMKENIDLARSFAELNERERGEIVSRVQTIADGTVEFYKS